MELRSQLESGVLRRRVGKLPSAATPAAATAAAAAARPPGSMGVAESDLGTVAAAGEQIMGCSGPARPAHFLLAMCEL